MPTVDDLVLNLWISCPDVAARYGQAPGYVAIPVGEHQALIDSGEAQSTDIGELFFWPLGDCSHAPAPAPTPAPSPEPPPPAPKRRASTREPSP